MTRSRPLRGVVLCMGVAALNGACASAPSPLQPQHAGSVGVPNRGVLTGGVELPKSGPGFERYRPHGKHHFGVPRLVRAIQLAAQEIQTRAPGPPLVVGDLSGPSGGKITGHNSHRTGRDVDLLYFATSPAGAPVRSPGFINFEADGLAHVEDSSQFYRFDVERVWLLVRSLLQNPEISVQFMFMSRPLESLLIDYALARGEPLRLVYHAAATLVEPKDALPHDDHLHLRIACNLEEQSSGCSGGGPWWEWFPSPEPALDPLMPSYLLSIAASDPLDSEGDYGGALSAAPPADGHAGPPTEKASM